MRASLRDARGRNRSRGRACGGCTVGKVDVRFEDNCIHFMGSLTPDESLELRFRWDQPPSEDNLAGLAEWETEIVGDMYRRLKLSKTAGLN